MYSFFRTLLFLLPPETAHHVSLQGLKILSRLLPAPSEKGMTPVTVFGLKFPNRVGLAAGLDKNGDYIDALGKLGFGFIEVGTVTPRAQPGNEKPRLFRLPASEAIINRMGFNNQGVKYLLERVKAKRFSGVLGINIGKNFDTPVDQANHDYLTAFEQVYDYADYVTVNISSPNTPGLRRLQGGDLLESLLSDLKQKQKHLSEIRGRYVPVLIKIAPDLELEAITAMADTFNRHRIDGLIATNTTFSRDGVQGQRFSEEQGGLSGRPLMQHSTEILRAFRQRLDASISMIAAGGISSPEEMQEKLDAGADLVQIYTGFIYQGPALVKALGRV